MAELKRDLTLFDLTMIAIGGTIGSGIFLTPALIAARLHSPFLILLVWLIGGLLALSGALTFAELGAMMPEAGGVYVYLTKAYGGLMGFLYGWAYFLVVNTGGLAALSIAFSTYLGYFIPLSSDGIVIAAIVGLVFVTILNVLGTKIGGIFSDVFTILKIIGIVGLVIIGIAGGSGMGDMMWFSFDVGDGSLSGAFAAALIGVLWSYGGWQHATYTAGEAKNPRRTVPLALVFGALTIAVVYLLTNISYLSVLSVGEMGGSERVAADMAERILGPMGGGLIALAIFISTFGTTGIYTLTAPRIYFAMAREGLFFKSVAQVHPRFQTPARAVMLQTGWGIILILFWGSFENLISYVVFTDWIFFGLAGLSVFLFRKRNPDAHRPYRTLGYPVTPMFFVGVSAWFVFNTLIERPAESLAGLGFLLLGVPVYYYWKRKQERGPVTGQF